MFKATTYDDPGSVDDACPKQEPAPTHGDGKMRSKKDRRRKMEATATVMMTTASTYGDGTQACVLNEDMPPKTNGRKKAAKAADGAAARETKEAPPTRPCLPVSVLGSERFGEILSYMDTNPDFIRCLILYPEEALTVDLPNMIFFDAAKVGVNNTVCWNDGVFSVALKRGSRIKWCDVGDVGGVLKVVAKHMMCIHDVMYPHHANMNLSAFDMLLVREYVRAIETQKDICISPSLPYLYGRVEQHVISFSRMLDAMATTIRTGSMVPQDKWVDASKYAERAL
jgi:hypothetical protein